MKQTSRILAFFIILLVVSCGQSSDIENGEINNSLNQPGTAIEPEEILDPEEIPDPEFTCVKSRDYQFIQESIMPNHHCRVASAAQIAEVKRGNAKKDQFLARCYKETNNSCWCEQLIRPNPSSLGTFRCTYGDDLPHQLIHPDESTWGYAIEAAKIVKELQVRGLILDEIYNWWRPEPYNRNVGGSPTRHPHGTSIDVRFMTKAGQEAAFLDLCRMRAAGRINAIGYYSTTAIHIGVGDHRGNTWGKSCP